MVMEWIMGHCVRHNLTIFLHGIGVFGLEMGKHHDSRLMKLILMLMLMVVMMMKYYIVKKENKRIHEHRPNSCWSTMLNSSNDYIHHGFVGIVRKEYHLVQPFYASFSYSIFLFFNFSIQTQTVRTYIHTYIEKRFIYRFSRSVYVSMLRCWFCWATTSQRSVAFFPVFCFVYPLFSCWRFIHSSKVKITILIYCTHHIIRSIANLLADWLAGWLACLCFAFCLCDFHSNALANNLLAWLIMFRFN